MTDLKWRVQVKRRSEVVALPTALVGLRFFIVNKY